jgi:RNA polymerase sigma factor (sigma-70 family)
MGLKSSENSFRILARSGSLRADMNERRRDFEQLQRFARHGEQSAFADVVRQHIDLVFGTALRKLEDPGAAQEVAQNVFTALAHKAWRFAPDDSLPAWLHKTALLESKSWLRGELRRRRREQTAAELGTTMTPPNEQPALNALVPLLDEALLSLREKDRTALLLRFYESRSLHDVGTSLGVNEDTAQKRVQGALEKISKFFRNRGFKTASVAASAAALQQTAASASVATASAVTAAVLKTAPPAVMGMTALLARLATLTKPQVAAVATSVAILAVAWQWHENQSARTMAQQLASQLENTRLEQNALNGEIERLQNTTNRLTTTLAKLTEQAKHTAQETRAFEAWKTRTRQVLLADDYHWPDNSPFVRIPKRLVGQIDPGLSVIQPGVFTPEARELLGLTSDERRAAEKSLGSYLDTMNKLVESRLFETNRPLHGTIPEDALASKIFAMPPLGDAAIDNARGLMAEIRQVLGKERGEVPEPDFDSDAFGWNEAIFNFKGAKNLLEAVAYIYGGDEPEVVFQWQMARGSMGSAGVALTDFLATADAASAKEGMDNLHAQFFPDVVTTRMRDWLQQEAERRVGKKGSP